MDLQKNKVYRCQITDYTADGTGFAKIEGRAVFVPRTAVGDQCDVRIVKVTKNVAFGRVEKIIVPSAQRTAPACPVADKCGGCCYQHITYGEELRAKEKKVRDALTRIGGQDGAKLLGITGAPTTEHYRNKAQYPAASLPAFTVRAATTLCRWRNALSSPRRQTRLPPWCVNG